MALAEKTRGMILAAGMGTRLRPLTYFRAKAAVPFLNRPLISYSLELFQAAEIEQVMVNLHHLPDTVKGAVGPDTPLEIHFSMEEKILGTAGCLGKVRDFFGRDRFVVSNGKTYFEQDLKEVIDHHDRSGAIVTMVLVPYRPGDPYNPVFLDSDNNVTGFARNRPKQVDTSCLGIYTGVQILEPEVLDWIPPGASDSVNQIYPKLMRKGYAIQGFMSESFWCECSTVERYLCNSLAVLKRRGGENLASTGLPPGCHGAILGDDVLVPSDTVVENSILWNGIKLGRGSSFQGVIITDGVEELPPDTHLQNVVVTPVLEDVRTFRRLPRIGDHYSLWPVS